jgi:(p)ppGpp synthase/HD superfamily hydrolase
MNLTQKIRLAIKIAAIQHNGQFRKDGTTPFLIHPIEVAFLVNDYAKDDDTVVAALL